MHVRTVSQGQLNGNETQIDALGAFLLKNYDYIASQTATNLTIYWAMVCFRAAMDSFVFSAVRCLDRLTNAGFIDVLQA